MKNTFDINRFYKLFKKEFKERIPLILKYAAIFSLILVGIWLTSLLINKNMRVPMDVRFVYISFSVFLAMIMAPFSLYKDYNHSKKGLDYSSLPASVLEKYISMVLMSLIIMPLIIITSILFTDSLIALLSPQYFTGYLLNEAFFESISQKSFAEIFILPSMFLFGNLIYRKNKVLKTILTTLGIYLIITIVLSFILLYLFKDQMAVIADAMEGKTKFSIDLRNMYDLYNSEFLAGYPGIRFTVGLFALLYSIGLPVGSLAGSYYRMKTIQY
ncbi:MAG: hypothetical protein A2X17_05100 [Bacteroidetes bacterium GWF2_41_61]|nr:MAG: hypothetical protein A2X20_07760 [Bacteroidetes bacterium GWE2_40_15]OFY36791.1 MAG: hypothetical protein A2X17_05100 [Bacteroidetes bacterium GWF2_41_61]HBG23722.1 hypothetical protein [Rikenellaceae bacterium]HBZ26029.1 hypothetical protein [Rikenellaceae bacterium]